MKTCEEYLKQLSLNNGTYVIVGCSYGPDSMCLLALLKKLNYKIVCAHVNHKIREESEEEYTLLKNYCNKQKIIFEGLTLEKGKYDESYYRKKRYNFYKSLADKYHTKYIMTAHHGDDLIETILMRISRGSYLKGYRGFDKRYEEKGYIFIKPLIYSTKEEIQKYNIDNNIPFAVDSTNDSDNYTRNRYRKYVVPELKKETSNLHLKYLQFSEEIKETCDYIDQIVNINIKDNYNDYSFDLEKFMQLNPFIQKMELKKVLSELYGDDIDKIKKDHVNDIVHNLLLGKNFETSLPLNKKVVREYNKLYIKDEKDVEKYNFLIDEKVLLPNGDIVEVVEKSDVLNNYVIRLKSSDISLPLYVRNRKDGDKIEIKNMNGTKKVKSVFIDEKISKEKRNEWPVVVDSTNQVLWLPGLRKSKFDITKDEKYDIILKYIKKGNNNENKEK